MAQNTTVLDTYRGIGDSIGRYSGILIPGIGGIDRKTATDRIVGNAIPKAGDARG